MAKTKTKQMIQPRISGVTRIGRSAGLLPEIDDAIVILARQYGVSPSWVQATYLARALNIKDQPDFREAKRLRKEP